jgi:RNA polymerase sigma-70 factor (ECF subfamily)
MNAAQPIERSRAVTTEVLFRSHATFVARLLARLGLPSDELDDAVQEVFLVVHRHGGYLPGPATPAGYLASIAVRVAASRRRRGRRSRERASTVAPDEMSSGASDPARSCEAREELAVVQDALDRLDPDLRTTLVLAELEGESCKDIAAMMRIPVGTVYWRLHRARKTFRTALGAGAPGAQVAAVAMLDESVAKGALERVRAQPVLVYDVVAGLSRLRGALPLVAKTPAWAMGLLRVLGWTGRVGVANPAVLSVVASVSLLPGAPVAAPMRAMTDGAAPRPTLAFLTRPPVMGALVAPSMADPPMDEPVVLPPAPAAPMEALAAAGPAHRMAGAAPVRAVATPPPGPAPASVPPAPNDPGSPAELDSDLQEIQGVAAAEHVLASDPARALALVRASDGRLAGGYLSEERRYIAVVALAALGRGPEAEVQGARFLQDYPDGPFTARVRAAVERQPESVVGASARSGR